MRVSTASDPGCDACYAHFFVIRELFLLVQLEVILSRCVVALDMELGHILNERAARHDEEYLLPA